MKIKKLIFLFIALFSLVSAWFFFLDNDKPSKDINNKIIKAKKNTISSDDKKSLSVTDPAQNNNEDFHEKNRKVPDGMTKESWERVLEYDGVSRKSNAPVDFYGMVVDQNGSGISDVKVNLQLSGYNESLVSKILKGAKTGEVKGNFTKRIEIITNENGFFSINGERGQFLRVMSLEKEGYTPPPNFSGSYMYRNNYGKKFNPDRENPIVFTMWKNSKPQILNSFKFKIKLKADGSETALNLMDGRLTKNTGNNVDMVVALKSDTTEGEVAKRYNWSLFLKAQNGGVSETTDTFLFLAPENGYVENYEITMNKDDPKWLHYVQNRKFYFKGRQGKIYASLTLSAYAYNRGHGVVLIDAIVNSFGGRNLEFRPKTERE
jgi:hypothetical protein